MPLDVEFDLSDYEALAKDVEGAERQLPFLISYSLNKAMQDARSEERTVMVSVFDRPTPWTLNSMQITPSTKRDLSATLDFKAGVSTYLNPEVQGGARPLKRSEIAFGSRYMVPTKFAPVDQYGNVQRGFLRQVMSQLGTAELMSGFNANMSTRSRKGAVKRAGGQFFIRGHVIYKRNGHKTVPMFVFTRPPSYRPRYPFFDAGRKVIHDRFEVHFKSAWDRYVVLGRGRKGFW